MLRNGLKAFFNIPSVVNNVRPLSMSAIKMNEMESSDSSKKVNLFADSEDTGVEKANRRVNISINTVTLLGGVVRNPILRLTNRNTEMAIFPLATNVSVRKNNGEVSVFTDFHDIIVFGKRANFVKSSIIKGDKVFVMGRLTTQDHTTETGDRFKKPVIIADIVQLTRSSPNKQQ